MPEKKDPRKVYRNTRIQLDGNAIHFDGKGNPETKTLKMYRMRGDVTIFQEAIDKFAKDNGYEKVYAPVSKPTATINGKYVGGSSH